MGLFIEETNMKIVCGNCGFQEAPENFHAVYEIETLQMIYIVCPKCGNECFFQHFRLPIESGNAMSMSHLLCAPSSYSKYEAIAYTEKQLQKHGFKSPIEIVKKWKEKSQN